MKYPIEVVRRTPFVNFGRDICGHLDRAETREWLVTNGIGGYACGTVPGMLTRHYHGLLVAALEPPLGRTLLLAKLDETATYLNRSIELGTNRWADGTVSPSGYLYLERFYLDDTVPVWQFAIADARLSKRVWMERGQNTTYVRYTLDRASAPFHLSLDALANYRDHHGGSIVGNWEVGIVGGGIDVVPLRGAIPLMLRGEGQWTTQYQWYEQFDLAVERYRGTGRWENHQHVATVERTLQPGESLTIAASIHSEVSWDAESAEAALHRQQDYDTQLRDRFVARWGHCDWLEQLALSADRFIVDRSIPGEKTGKTVIAGYPWFGDWGRDTAISLPGLTMAAGRPKVARSILQTFARYFDRGMMPNLFPDGSNSPAYNTVDAVLWYFEALRAYFEATKDIALIETLFPSLSEVVDWHCRGTRYNIHLDDDGLLYAGEPDVQLTWMDAKVDDWVVTPRQGKPVEVNALWYNALCTMVQFARVLGKSHCEYEQLVDRARRGFDRFWYAEGGYCYDVVDTPLGVDTSLRPNQIFAVSLSNAPLTGERAKSVVDVVGRKLLTSYGLRSLSPDDPRYCERYGGDRLQRDGAYHQGTVWTWPLGAFAEAHFRVYGDVDRARSFLKPLREHLCAAGLGSISEIFDGEAPHHPRGCFAQAWSVAEVLRVMGKLRQFELGRR
ncbi:MAG: glycogen debranching enzyme family protein [Cyanobacteria bacterium SID2]|nr:glycogen debranching enzyme family protein [Cyanobacteria bacterium SID2]